MKFDDKPDRDCPECGKLCYYCMCCGNWFCHTKDCDQILFDEDDLK